MRNEMQIDRDYKSEIEALKLPPVEAMSPDDYDFLDFVSDGASETRIDQTQIALFV